MKISRFKVLQSRPDHICVLFVQHPLENTLDRPVLKRSVVVCARGSVIVTERRRSQFDAPWTNYPGNNFDSLVGGSGTVTGVNQFTYTADFGQGVTASFSAEDATAYYQAGNLNMSGASAAGMIGGSYGSNAIGGS